MHTGTKFDYLGMNLDFEGDGGVAIDMFKHVDKLLDDFPEEITGKAATPAAKHLFDVRENGEKLDRKDADAFHHSTAQMLFISSRARRDLQPTVAFLTTRVKGPDKDDWGKLKRALKHVNGTRRLKLRIKINSLQDILNLLWFIDGSHCVHWDSRGHGGATLMMGEGAMASYSNRLRVNTRSSTETEVVTVDRYMPEILWTMNFLREQGFPVELSRIAQDNQAAQQLETRGRFSSTSRTKHFKNKVFFVKDQVDQGEVAIVDCPTSVMWADFMTKPLQGQLYKEMRVRIMGCDVDYVDALSPAPKSVLRVPTAHKMSTHSSGVSSLTPKTRAPGARPFAQECVGRTIGESAEKQAIGKSAKKRTIGESVKKQVRFGSLGVDSRIVNRGRLWSEVVKNGGRARNRTQ